MQPAEQLGLFGAAPPTGKQLRDEGMQRAVDHADAVEPSWSDRAYALALGCLEPHGTGWQFIGETVRQFAEEHALPKPPDKRAWGAVMMRLAKAGKTKKVGWATATDPKVHCNPVSLWEKT